MIYEHMTLDSHMHAVYDVNDLMSIRWFGDDGIEEFKRIWDFTRHRLHPESGVNEFALRNILHRKIPIDSKAFGLDLREFRRNKEKDSATFNHQWLLDMFDRHILYLHQLKLEETRDSDMKRFMKGGKGSEHLEAKDAAAAAKAKGKGDKGKKGGGGGGGGGPSGPKGPGKGKGKGKKGDRPCYYFQLGTCTFDPCYFKHYRVSNEEFAKMTPPQPSGNRARTPSQGREKVKFCGEFSEKGTCQNIKDGKPCQKLHYTKAMIDEYNKTNSQGKGKGGGKSPDAKAKAKTKAKAKAKAKATP